ncbi:MAG: alanine:cation symporter family protein [Clostridiales bacterium]|nr:alanine:cation symporter family protein [Clostridiales bacterium]
MLMFFLLVGAMFTIRTDFFQVTQIRRWTGETLLKLFGDGRARRSEDRHAITQFQSLCTALAATIGTGSIAGVATAIALGGPGSVFWMWFSAFLGMMTSYAEKALGVRYRCRDEKGNWTGGAMIYMERGLHCRWMAVLFSLFCFLASFGIGNMTQANSIAAGLEDSFGVPPVTTALVTMALVAMVIMGGLGRIASVTERMVPLMAGGYILSGFVVVGCNLDRVPEAFSLIFREAFRFRAAGGGVLGYGIAEAMRLGISRGVFSNEAGLGSSVMVHAASDVKEPAVQGMWGVFEVFVDTMVVCTVTCLVILTSGVYDMEAYLRAIASGGQDAVVSGTALTARAFASVIPQGDKLVVAAIVVFAFATLIGWSYYGERTAVYLFGKRAVFPYKVLFVLVIFAGCTGSLTLVWDIADTLNGFMAVPNLLALTLLSGEVIRMTRAYLAENK